LEKVKTSKNEVVVAYEEEEEEEVHKQRKECYPHCQTYFATKYTCVTKINTGTTNKH
jgi:hypothetical protein